MSERPRHWNPEAPSEDYVPLAAASVGYGLLLGAAIAGAVLLGVRALVTQAPLTDQPDPFQPAGLLLIFGTLSACAIAGIACWTAMAPVSAYRRGGLSLVTTFATFVMALLMAPVNELAGPVGLAAVVLVCALGVRALGMRIARLRGQR